MQKRLVFIVLAVLIASFLSSTLYDSTGQAVRSQRTSVAEKVITPTLPSHPLGTTITVDLTPSTLQGIAPLAVFFDASGTTSDATTRPFHELSYAWDFGDALAGQWALNARDKNSDTGPLAIHVFDKPGRYTVILVVKTVSGATAQKTTLIEVLDPTVVFSGANTICFGQPQTPDFTGCPSGAQQIRSNSFADIQPYFQTNKRLLLQRGGTWTNVNSGLTITTNGPGILGAYGSGNKPKIIGDGVSRPFAFIQINGPLWTVMDLDITGPSATADQNGNYGIAVGSNVRSVLVYRNDIRKMPNKGLIKSWDTTGDSLFWIENTVTNTGVWSAYLGGSRIGIAGNVMQDVGTAHILRTMYAKKTVITDNDLENPTEGGHTLKFHADQCAASVGCATPVYAEYAQIAYNRFVGSSLNVMLTPQNMQVTNERLRDIIFEGNYLVTKPNVQVTVVGLSIVGQDVTVRNNIFEGKGSQSYYVGAYLPSGYASSVGYPTQRVDFFNNVFSRFDNPPSYSEFTGVMIKPDVTQVQLKNNIFTKRQGAVQGGYDVAYDFSSSVRMQEIASDYNLFSFTQANPITINGARQSLATFQSSGKDTHSISADAQLQNAAQGDYSLSSTSPAIDKGVLVPVFTDYVLHARPEGSAMDMGAYEYTSCVQPVLTSIIPSTVDLSQTYQSLDLFGSGFSTSAVVYINGLPYYTQFTSRISSSQLRITVPQGAPPGTYSLSVANCVGKASSSLPLIVATPSS